MALVKVTVFYKEVVKIRADCGFFESPDITMTTTDLAIATGRLREIGALYLTCEKTGMIYIVPEHQIGFVRATPIEEKAEANG
jgi:hypothetical protein